ncbi:FAD-dependent monooxygenase [Nocardia beijingensis]|uniref:NAD(P)/FAD-dependent oxidoreductase n=1 Tax=Nocardia beijingensis TaxID=95162 RepID=UPI00189387D6|nr:FAD-dependent monooxygenase [Nocardia beijingensis]MBF6467490.1 FAD-dependent monooxygenase [Nocardia beijingensis]
MRGSPSPAIEYTDVVVVGARCAGSAAAVAFARAGRDVLVLDSARFPSDTLSTHLLWPGGLAELRRVGALARVLGLGAPPLTTAFADGGGYQVRSSFTPVDGVDYAMCVRRTGLDAALVATAVDAGARVRQGVRVTALLWSGGRCVGVRCADGDGAREVRARLVVGADGRRSTVARLVGVTRPRLSAPSGRDCYFAYWHDGAADQRHIAAQWRSGPDLGTAFPCDGGLLLSLVQPPAHPGEPGAGRAERRYQEAIEQLPGLRRRLRDCRRVGRVRSATRLASYFRRSTGPGWALPGDAGHFKDPVTAQGIRDALRYGRLLGELTAVALDDPEHLDTASAAWERLRDRECLGVYQWTNRLARGTAMRPLEIELYRRAATDPTLADAVTEIFSRTVTPAEIFTPARAATVAAGALRASWRAPWPVLANLVGECRDAVFERREACAFTRPDPADAIQSRPPRRALAASSGDRHA